MFFLLFLVLCPCLFTWCLMSFIYWWFYIFLLWLLFVYILIFDISINAHSCKTDICAFTVSCRFFFRFLSPLFIILTLLEGIDIICWPTEVPIIIKLTINEIMSNTEAISFVYLLKLRAELILRFRRGKHDFQFLNSLPHFLFNFYQNS